MHNILLNDTRNGIPKMWFLKRKQKQIVRDAEAQKYMFTYHIKGQFNFMLYCTFRSNKYISGWLNAIKFLVGSSQHVFS